LLALTPVLALGTGVLSGPGQAAATVTALKTVTVKVVGIDRNGKSVGVYDAAAVDLGDRAGPGPYFGDPAGVIRLRPGSYAIGADAQAVRFRTAP
jgi:hypothetical protein